MCKLRCYHFFREFGGYGYKFVDTVPPKYRCGICTNVLKDARLTACCGQHFCDSCLTQWLNRQCGGNKTCPHCRKEDFISILNLEKIREIKEMQVHCTNLKKGCQWVGELGRVQQHLQQDSGCNFFEVKCVNYGYKNYFWDSKMVCGVKVERRFLTNHQKNDCKYRQYTCEYCGYFDTYDAIAGTGSVGATGFSCSVVGDTMNHYEKCAKFPIKCPNECGVTSLKWKDLKAHLGTCPLESITCPYSDCSLGSILRKDVETHIKVCYYRPYTCEHCGTATYQLQSEGDHHVIMTLVTIIRLNVRTNVALAKNAKTCQPTETPAHCSPLTAHSRLSVALQQLHVKIWTVMFR